MRNRILVLLLGPLLLLAGCTDHPTPLAPDEQALTVGGPNGPGHIPGRFIVALQPNVNATAVAAEYGLEPDHVYNHVLNGFAGSIADAARQGLLGDGRVVRVERDGWVHPTNQVQADATWGLDRIDQRAHPLDGQYRYSRTGSGVTVYIIDSGIRFSHSEFGGRASNGHDFALQDDPDNTDPNQQPGEDCWGHGTQVAGTVGGETYGVAKDVQLVSVRVFGCDVTFESSPASRVIAAMDWTTADHLDRIHTNGDARSVANMSLAYPGDSELFDDAVRRMISAGVATAVSAGNYNRLDGACDMAPARIAEAMTVASTDSDDRRSSYSNHGRCTDWYAPGRNIETAWHTSDVAVGTLSGTSMSSPHTAGVAALYLEAHPQASPAEVFDALRRATTRGAVWEWQYHHGSGKIIGQREIGDLLYSLIDEPGISPEITDLAAEALSSSEIELTWRYSGAEPGEIEIQRRNPGEPQFVTVATRPAGDESFTDTGLEAFTLYSYRVRAIPAADPEWWSVVVDARTDAGDGVEVSVNIYEVECPPSQNGRCTFRSEWEGHVTSVLWTVESEHGSSPLGLSDPVVSVNFLQPGSYTVTVSVTDAFGNTAADSETVDCRVQGNKLRCR